MNNFETRLAARLDELKWLYSELYGETPCFEQLIGRIRQFAASRKPALTALDRAREADPEWYRRSDMLGMMMYTEQFADSLAGI